MQKEIKKKLLHQQEHIKTKYKHLSDLRQKYREEEERVDLLKRKIFNKNKSRTERKLLESVLDDMKMDKMETDYTMEKAEDELLFRFSELYRNRLKAEQSNEEQSIYQSPTNGYSESVDFSTYKKNLSELISDVRFSCLIRYTRPKK